MINEVDADGGARTQAGGQPLLPSGANSWDGAQLLLPPAWGQLPGPGPQSISSPTSQGTGPLTSLALTKIQKDDT